MRHAAVVALALIAGMTACRAAVPDACGEVVAIETHERTTTRYTLTLPTEEKARGEPIALAMMVGDRKARKPWVAQTVFSVDLEAIKVPVLVIGHAADNCVRSPADMMGDITTRIRRPRQRIVTVTGGPMAPGRIPDLASCEVREPHDFVEQEAEVAARITAFIRGE